MVLTNSDVAKSVQWFVGWSNGNSHGMLIFLTGQVLDIGKNRNQEKNGAKHYCEDCNTLKSKNPTVWHYLHT